MSEHNVIAVTFRDRGNAFQALSEMKGAAFEGRVDVIAANVVFRDDDGGLKVSEGVDNVGGAATLGGSLVGVLIGGAIGGPVGLLVGWAGGMLVGGAFDIRRANASTSVLGEISARIPVGGTALIAEVDEVAEEVIDTEMGKLGGMVFRRPAEAVLAELEAAEEAYGEAQKQADRVDREERKAERKKSFEDRKSELKERLSVG